MPARSCQYPERRAPIASRRWEVCSKPGDGTTVVRCKECGAIWTTRGKFADTMPYDIGPVTLPRDAFQHTRAIVALTMLDALLYQFRPLVEDQPKVLRHLDEMREIIEACGTPIRKRRTSAGAQRDLHAACDAMYESYRDFNGEADCDATKCWLHVALNYSADCQHNDEDMGDFHALYEAMLRKEVRKTVEEEERHE